VEQKYLIDSVRTNMNPGAFFDLLLPMRGTLPVGSPGFEDQVFGSLIDWLWFSAGLFSVQDILFVSLNRVMRWYTRCREA
jgi:hypothetical protein